MELIQMFCKFYNKGQSCPFGTECNYAHGDNQLNVKTEADDSDNKKKTPLSRRLEFDSIQLDLKV